MDDNLFSFINVYSVVLQESVLNLIDLWKILAALGSTLLLIGKARDQFINEIYRYREKIVLRPVEISNSPEVIRRLGVIAINTAIES